jgi:hypothetical protein
MNPLNEIDIEIPAYSLYENRAFEFNHFLNFMKDRIMYYYLKTNLPINQVRNKFFLRNYNPEIEYAESFQINGLPSPTRVFSGLVPVPKYRISFAGDILKFNLIRKFYNNLNINRNENEEPFLGRKKSRDYADDEIFYNFSENENENGPDDSANSENKENEDLNIITTNNLDSSVNIPSNNNLISSINVENGGNFISSSENLIFTSSANVERNEIPLNMALILL